MTKRILTFVRAKGVGEIKAVRFLFGFFQFLKNGIIRSRRDILLLSHFGLGDQLIIGNLINQLALKSNVLLPVDDKYFLQIKEFYSYNSKIRVINLGHLGKEFYPRADFLRDLRRTYNVPILDIGRNVIYMLSFFSRRYGISQLYYFAAWSFNSNFVNVEAFNHLYDRDQEIDCTTPFAFIDHHPGTSREIPSRDISSILDRGLLLTYNNPKKTLIEQIPLVVNASELHLVASAPFCMAFVLPVKAKIKVVYDAQKAKPALGAEGLGWVHKLCN